MAKPDIYQMVTDKIIEQLEKGVIPWRKPWNGTGGMPMNFKSKKAYRGINVWMLHAQEFNCNAWLTYKQVDELGGNVIKGMKSTPIVFWNFLEKENKSGDIKKIPMLKYYRVFNLEQVEGIEIPAKESEEQILEFNPIDEANNIYIEMPNKPVIKMAEETKDERAFYSPSIDYINMPSKKKFETEEHYYATLFHELGHSTGHDKRLDRDTLTKINTFGDHSYSKEELVAEMTSAYLCCHCNIDNEDLFSNTTAYIKGWLSKLRSDKKYLMDASKLAQNATDHILNISFKEA